MNRVQRTDRCESVPIDVKVFSARATRLTGFHVFHRILQMNVNVNVFHRNPGIAACATGSCFLLAHGADRRRLRSQLSSIRATPAAQAR